MSSGALINVLSTLILLPIVTRFYTKEDFGVFSLYIAITSFLALIGTALYPTAIVIPKLKRQYYALLKLILYFAAITFVISNALVFALSETAISVFNLSGVELVIFLVPLGVLLTNLHDILLNRSVRAKSFARNASANVISGVSSKVLNILYALVYSGSGVILVFSHLVAIFLSLLSLGITSIYKELQILKRISFKEIKDIARQYSKYPTHLLPANVVNKLTNDLPIYVLTAYFSPAVTGAYFLANRILSVPLTIIGNSTAAVFLQRSNELYHTDKKEMQRFAYEVHKKMLYLGVLIFGVIFAFGDIIFNVVFGDGWELAGEMSQALSIYFIFKLASGPLAKIYRVVGKEEYSLYISIFLAITRTMGIFLGLYTNDPMITIWCFVLGNLVGYYLNMMMIYKVIDHPLIQKTIESTIIVIISFCFFSLCRYLMNPLMSGSV